jgi:pimeloyl-ACP methyl ester carboxylesterase
MSDLHVNGIRIHFEEHGRGEPLLLLHGGSLTLDSWQPYLAALAEHYRVITPDTRAHGRSVDPDTPLSYRLLADDVAALAGGLGLRQPLIAGYSDGGQIALELGMRHPDLPRALIIGGAWANLTPQYLSWVREAVGHESSPDIDLAVFAQNHPEWKAWLDTLYEPDRWKALLKQLKPMWFTPLTYTAEDFARIVAPALVLIGDRDELVPLDEAIGMFRGLPAAELAIVPDADHGAFFSARVDAFQSLMLDFLRRHSQSAR